MYLEHSDNSLMSFHLYIPDLTLLLSLLHWTSTSIADVDTFTIASVGPKKGTYRLILLTIILVLPQMWRRAELISLTRQLAQLLPHVCTGLISWIFMLRTENLYQQNQWQSNFSQGQWKISGLEEEMGGAIRKTNYYYCTYLCRNSCAPELILFLSFLPPLLTSLQTTTAAIATTVT